MLGNKAKKELRSLDREIKSRVLDLFARLEEEPVPYKEYDLRKIEARDESYRIRLSSFRVLYSVSWAEKIVWVAKIERRSENTYD